MARAPKWLLSASQGLAYWIGYQRSIYSEREMLEAAIAAQLGILIHSHLPNELHLRFEQPYSKFLPKGVSRPEVSDRSLADISIWESYIPMGKTKSRKKPVVLIELKRAVAKASDIQKDLKRLAAVAEETDGLRTFLCVVSEEKRPKLFITPKGVPVADERIIPDTTSRYIVSHVRKAAPLFTKKEKAHYVCVLEIMSGVR